MTSTASFKLRSVALEENSPLKDDERLMVEGFIASARRMVVHVPDGKLGHPSWLLSKLEDDYWITANGVQTRFYAGKWRGTVDVSWDVQLPDGRRLSDPEYGDFNSTLKQIARAYRDGLADGVVPALSTWVSFCHVLKALAVWMVLHKGRLRPSECSFALVDNQALSGLFTQLGRGGWTEAHGIVQRTLRRFYTGAIGGECPDHVLDDPMNLPSRVRRQITYWLTSEGAFGIRSKGLISRAFIANIIHCEKRSLAGASNQYYSFLRQFEAEAIDSSGLLRTVGNVCEFASNSTPLLSSVSKKPASFGPAKIVAVHVGTLAKLYRVLGSKLIRPGEIDVAEFKRLGRVNSVAVRQTPFIPFAVASRHVGEAIHWVLNYGDALVAYYLAVLAEATRQTKPYACKSSARRKKLPEVLRALPLPVELSAISKGFHILAANTVGPNHHQSLRERPTIQQAIEVLVGAIVVLLGMLKPCRVSEITSLRRDCLSFNGHYFIETQLAKRSVGEQRANSGPKPIPSVVARGIIQLQTLGNGLSQLFDEQDHFQRGALFYLPSRLSGKAKVITDRMLDRYIDMFVDYVAYPPDELGRRWYLRIHQMRRWFLLHLYWTGRSGALDACVFMAGHTDPQHMQSYIALEGGGETMESLEALYVMDLLHMESSNSEPRGGALIQLREQVLRYFGAASLDFVPARQFKLYLQELIESGTFSVRPSTVADRNGLVHTTIGFHFEACRMPSEGD